MFPIFFILGSKLLKKYPFTLTYTIGLTLITLALVYALTGGPLFEANPYYVLIAAAIVGCGEGFYYLSANTCNQIVSTAQSRPKFLSFNGMFTNITSLLSPIYASFLLSVSETEMVGYRRMLVTIICVFAVVIIVALSMNKMSEDKDSHISKVIITKDDKQWTDHNKAVFFYGLRNALELNTISLLLYKASGGSGLYSKLTILFTFITIVSYRVISRFLEKDKIDRTFKIGVLIKTISTFILVFLPNVVGAIIFGVANAFATVLYDNSYNYLSAVIIGRYPTEMTARVVARETYLSLSRCTSMLIVIMCYKFLPESIYLQVSVPILALATIPCERILLKYK
ncbi:MAG: MFS transporter [Bacillota bacterium]|nr:MFS transporter [Bacillota bacterium]